MEEVNSNCRKRNFSDTSKRNCALSKQTIAKSQAECETQEGLEWGPGSGKLMLAIIVFQARSAPAMTKLSHLELGEHSPASIGPHQTLGQLPLSLSRLSARSPEGLNPGGLSPEPERSSRLNLVPACFLGSTL